MTVLSISPFDKQIKRLVKKYPSLKTEFANLIDSLEYEPQLGIPLGYNCFKIKISIASKGKGKSGGGRVITNFVIRDETVYLLAIYDKSEKDAITDKELQSLLKYVPQ